MSKGQRIFSAHLGRAILLFHQKRLFRAIIGTTASISTMGAVNAAYGQEANGAPAKPILALRAVGAQIYQCRETAPGHLRWMLREPVAALLEGDRTVGTHSRGPSWKLEDGSDLEGRAVSESPGRSRTDVPQARLAVTQNNGRGRLAQATSVEREDTKGGMPPESCSSAEDLLPVPYTATYIFYR
ncbi:DUF3455 domain-containing protein [Gluconacetobacter sp. Hr-1-5]|uniref:DUF3455 domain-containing protein n=1 Tax=Gluconacetobacter sp. Hr-1-5 TaxID=3395370 RepID=UPI003B52B45E